MEFRCPGCQGKNVGKVGTGQYYCWDCFIEFAVTARGVRLYDVSADGELERRTGGVG
jgi:ribosomal protein L37AE/L43A